MNANRPYNWDQHAAGAPIGVMNGRTVLWCDQVPSKKMGKVIIGQMSGVNYNEGQYSTWNEVGKRVGSMNNERDLIMTPLFNLSDGTYVFAGDVIHYPDGDFHIVSVKDTLDILRDGGSMIKPDSDVRVDQAEVTWKSTTIEVPTPLVSLSGRVLKEAFTRRINNLPDGSEESMRDFHANWAKTIVDHLLTTDVESVLDYLERSGKIK